MHLREGEIIRYKSPAERYLFLILNITVYTDFGIGYNVLDLETGKQLDFMFYPIDHLYIEKVV